MKTSIMNSVMQRLRQQRNDDSGMASILVTLILIFVIAIVIMGFSVVIQRNERQVIDRNLSARAFYAAESGVNMAIHNISSYPTGKSSCEAAGPLDYTIDSTSSTQVTCLTINNTPTSLVYDSIGEETSQAIPFNALSGTINNIDFNWQSTVPATSFPASCNTTPTPSRLPASGASTCNAPLLRIDLVPSDGSSLSRDNLLNNVFTVFAYPVPHTSGTGSGSVSYTVPVKQGNVASGFCSTSNASTGNAPRQCKLRVTGLSGIAYTARVMSFYGDMSLTVCANSGLADSCDVKLKGVQAVIDSTARAMDVVRRIQVRYKLAGDSIIPSSTVQTAAGLCKRYGVIPSTSTTDIIGEAGVDLNSACSY